MMTFLSRNRTTILSAFLLLMISVVHMTGGEIATASKPKNSKSAKRSTPQGDKTVSPAEGGWWSAKFALKTTPVHISLLPNGKLLYWGRDKADDGWDVGGHTNTFPADPLYLEDTAYTSTIANGATNLFCSGHSFLPDGRLFVTGGHVRPAAHPWFEGVGETAINIFDYRTNAWTLLPTAMPRGRWYPYNITMANGETVIMGGTWSNADSIPGPCPNSLCADTKDNIFPDVRTQAGGLRVLTDNSTGLFPNIKQYPYISLTPNNKVFVASPSSRPAIDSGLSRMLDVYAQNSSGGNGVFTNVDVPTHPHIEGSSVMYAPGRVLMLGGKTQAVGFPVTSLAETINVSDTVPNWTVISPMALARHYPNATLLPDGKVLVTGGTSCNGSNNLDCGPGGQYGGAVQTPELWDPANQSVWKAMNPTPNGVPRVYHSVALLMPDARVLVGGGGLPLASGETGDNGIICAGDNQNSTHCTGAGHPDVEFFSPPYLYNSDGTDARRPAIVSAPDIISYNQHLTIEVGNVSPATIQNVVLIRLPSVTHTYNQDQRRVDLGPPAEFDRTSIRVIAPANGVDCPPGPYMMFLISNNGRNTPSVARIVRVGDYSREGKVPVNSGFQTFSPFVMSTGTISVNAVAGVAWVAEVEEPASHSWLRMTAASGVGSGSASFTVDPNTNPATRREGSIRIRVPGRDDVGSTFTVYQAGSFSDVPAPQDTYVSKVNARGVMAGCGGTQFCLQNIVTRDQMAAFLTTLLQPNAPFPLVQRFLDVPLSSPRAADIEFVTRRKISDTTSCGSSNLFCPGQALTRKDMVVWLVRSMGIDNPPAPTSSSFNDISVSDPACAFIEEAVRRGIVTSGCGGTKTRMFCPNDPVTRGQLAVFLSQAFKL